MVAVSSGTNAKAETTDPGDTGVNAHQPASDNTKSSRTKQKSKETKTTTKPIAKQRSKEQTPVDDNSTMEKMEPVIMLSLGVKLPPSNTDDGNNSG